MIVSGRQDAGVVPARYGCAWVISKEVKEDDGTGYVKRFEGCRAVELLALVPYRGDYPEYRHRLVVALDREGFSGAMVEKRA